MLRNEDNDCHGIFLVAVEHEVIGVCTLLRTQLAFDCFREAGEARGARGVGGWEGQYPAGNQASYLLPVQFLLLVLIFCYIHLDVRVLWGPDVNSPLALGT